jgi:hypothetical protein
MKRARSPPRSPRSTSPSSTAFSTLIKRSESWLRKEKKFEVDVAKASLGQREEIRCHFSPSYIDLLSARVKESAEHYVSSFALKAEVYFAMWELECLEAASKTRRIAEIHTDAEKRKADTVARVRSKIEEMVQRATHKYRSRAVSNASKLETLMHKAQGLRKQVLALIREMKANRITEASAKSRLDACSNELDTSVQSMADMETFGHYETLSQLYRVLFGLLTHDFTVWHEIAFAGEEVKTDHGIQFKDSPTAELPRVQAASRGRDVWTFPYDDREYKALREKIQEHLKAAADMEAPTPPLAHDEPDLSHSRPRSPRGERKASPKRGSPQRSPKRASPPRSSPKAAPAPRRKSPVSTQDAEDDEDDATDIGCDFCNKESESRCDWCDSFMCGKHLRQCEDVCEQDGCKAKGLWACPNCVEAFEEDGNTCPQCKHPR